MNASGYLALLFVSALLYPVAAAPWTLADLAVRDPLEVQDWRLKFGVNEDIDTGTAEDVWTAGGDCEWPAAAATTTLVSSSTADAAAGTGCRTVQVQCLDDDLAPVPQTLTMDGTSAVTFGTDCRRTTRAKCLTAGTGGTNAGTIDIKHGATIIGQIAIGYGQTLIACDTVPDGYTARLASWHCSLNKSNAGVIQFSIDARSEGGAWQVKETFDANSTGSGVFFRRFSGWQTFAEHTDVRVRARTVSANNMGASCGFDMLLLAD
jgi:hypothetical protein